MSTWRSQTGVGFVTACSVALCMLPVTAIAGPIGVISTLIMVLYVALAVAIGLALLGLVLARFIVNPVHRAMARLAIVLLVATPVPTTPNGTTSAFQPALTIALTRWTGSSHGLFAYALPIAYAVSFAAFVPLVLLWFRLGERYRVRR